MEASSSSQSSRLWHVFQFHQCWTRWLEATSRWIQISSHREAKTPELHTETITDNNMAANRFTSPLLACVLCLAFVYQSNAFLVSSSNSVANFTKVDLSKNLAAYIKHEEIRLGVIKGWVPLTWSFLSYWCCYVEYILRDWQDVKDVWMSDLVQIRSQLLVCFLSLYIYICTYITCIWFVLWIVYECIWNNWPWQYGCYKYIKYTLIDIFYLLGG